jgi:uncharacterized protein (TIGR02246 family)
VCVLALAAAPARAAECGPDAPAVKRVRAVADGIVAADNARALDRVIAFYAPDAALMPPGEPPVRGRDAIRPRYAALFAAFDPAIEGRIEEACADGATAFVTGHNGGRMKSRTGQPDRLLDDYYVMLLRADAAGAWRITHLIWHAGQK